MNNDTRHGERFTNDFSKITERKYVFGKSLKLVNGPYDDLGAYSVNNSNNNTYIFRLVKVFFYFLFLKLRNTYYIIRCTRLYTKKIEQEDAYVLPPVRAGI